MVYGQRIQTDRETPLFWTAWSVLTKGDADIHVRLWPDQTRLNITKITSHKSCRDLPYIDIDTKCITIQYDVLMVRSNSYHYGMAIHGLPVLVSTAHAQSPVAVSMSSAWGYDPHNIHTHTTALLHVYPTLVATVTLSILSKYAMFQTLWPV